MLRRPPISTRLDTLFPARRSSDLLNPRATVSGLGGVTPIRTGRIYDGGSIVSGPTEALTGQMFRPQLLSSYVLVNSIPNREARTVAIMDGATLDISGVTDLYDQAIGASSVLGAPGFAPGLVWSNEIGRAHV